MVSSLGERIRARRKELGLTQTELGGADLTKGFVSLLEAGRARPSAESLVLIARRLEVSPASILDDDATLSAKVLQVTVAAGWAKAKPGDYTGAAEAFNEALTLAIGQRDQAGQAECYIGLAYALAGLRQYDLAHHNVQLGREIAEALGMEHHLVRANHVLGLIEYYRRNLSAAREHFSEGYRRFQLCDHPDRSLGGTLLYNLGNTYLELGDYADAIHWYQQALPLLESAEDLHRVGLVHLQLGVARREHGDFETALEHLTRAELLFEALNDTRFLGWAHNSIGITLLAAGKVDGAIAHIEASLRIKEQIGDDPGRARTLTELGRALTAKGIFNQADEALDEAERLAKRFGDVTELARIELARAGLRDADGQTSEAIRWYKAAIGSFEALHMHADLARACNALGDLLLKCKRSSQAAPYLSRALEVLRTQVRR